MQKLGKFQYQRPDESEGKAIGCCCCRETGYVQLTELIRDESGELPNMLSPMQCKNCQALYLAFTKCLTQDERSNKEKRQLTHSEILDAIALRCDTRATQEQCAWLHQMGLEDLATIRTIPEEAVELIEESLYTMEF